MTDKSIVELARRRGWIVRVHNDCTVEFCIPLWVCSYEPRSGEVMRLYKDKIYTSQRLSLDGTLEKQIQNETNALLEHPIWIRGKQEDELQYLQRIATVQVQRDSWSALCKAIAERNSVGGD